MKIIFLDIDGVLNCYPQGHDEFGSKFHKHFEDNLRTIIDATGARIVITSTWRANGLSNMKEMWLKRGLPGAVVGITPHNEGVRGDQIERWLHNHSKVINNGPYEVGISEDQIELWLTEYDLVTKFGDVENYVIIDDDDDMLDEQMSNFVKTSGNTHHTDYIDAGGYGLTLECTEEAIKILNNEKS